MSNSSHLQCYSIGSTISPHSIKLHYKTFCNFVLIILEVLCCPMRVHRIRNEYKGVRGLQIRPPRPDWDGSDISRGKTVNTLCGKMPAGDQEAEQRDLWMDWKRSWKYIVWEKRDRDMVRWRRTMICGQPWRATAQGKRRHELKHIAMGIAKSKETKKGWLPLSCCASAMRTGSRSWTAYYLRPKLTKMCQQQLHPCSLSITPLSLTPINPFGQVINYLSLVYFP